VVVLGPSLIPPSVLAGGQSAVSQFKHSAMTDSYFITPRANTH
jgi:hypothetical protein